MRKEVRDEFYRVREKYDIYIVVMCAYVKLAFILYTSDQDIHVHVRTCMHIVPDREDDNQFAEMRNIHQNEILIHPA